MSSCRSCCGLSDCNVSGTAVVARLADSCNSPHEHGDKGHEQQMDLKQPWHPNHSVVLDGIIMGTHMASCLGTQGMPRWRKGLLTPLTPCHTPWDGGVNGRSQ